MSGELPFERLIAEASRRSIPLEVSLELTHHCNFRCHHCYIPDFSAPDLLTTERVLRLLEELAEMGTLFLTLTGGEMFLRRDWLPIASHARRLGFKLRLFSNASLITDAVADAIAALPAAVEVSLYSMDAEIFERITQRQGSFARTIAGIERLRGRGVEVLLKVPIMTHNLAGVGDVFAYARRVGAECRADRKIVHRKDGDTAPHRLQVPEQQLLPHYGGPYSSCSIPAEHEGPERGGPLCAAANRFCNITSAGDVLACNIMPGSGGNLRERSFRDIWENSEWLKQVRAIRRKDLPVCGTCPKISYCGRCHAQALVEEGNLLAPQRSACDHAGALEKAFDRSA